jgi:hypothetical protein
LDEATENGKRMGIDDDKEEGADSLKTDGLAGKKKKTGKMEPAEDSLASEIFCKTAESSSNHNTTEI